jgi:predicted phosphohydrolase
MAQIDSDPDYILVTGDFIGHFVSTALDANGSWSEDQDNAKVDESFRNITSAFR